MRSLERSGVKLCTCEWSTHEGYTKKQLLGIARALGLRREMSANTVCARVPKSKEVLQHGGSILSSIILRGTFQWAALYE